MHGHSRVWLCGLLLAASAAVLHETEASSPGVPSDFEKEAWVFSSPERPELPSTQNKGWARNAIDTFVLARLEAIGIQPNQAADKYTLLRRVNFDLTGLPPTPEEIRDFSADRSPEAYERVVERLLASPQFGERWAQHWLDVVRYAETEGFKADTLRENAYKYRDYVIRAFNSDLPYDRFVQQQLAGDELEPDNPDALIATGLNRLYPDENNAANLVQRHHEILADVTDTNSLTFMALTMGCARCHDHKFDPITHADYYRLQAFFAPLVERDVPAVDVSQCQAYDEQYATWQEATAEIRLEMESLLAVPRAKSDAHAITKFREEIQQFVRKEDRSPFEQQIAEMAERQLDRAFDPHSAMKKQPEPLQERYFELERKLAQFDHLKPATLPQAMVATDLGSIAPPTHRLEGGNWRTPAEEVEPGFPAVFGNNDPDCSPATGTTGRRAALAKWLTRRDHPLTARVIVNRLWHHHFGRGIIATPNDFGTMGDPPTHPELLDWLAVELVEHNWSLKHIHRLMVTSATYRQSSLVDSKDAAHARARELDPQNKLLWHARRQRLEGEALRDAMLLVSGELNRQMFGPSVKPRLPDAIGPRYRWKESDSWQQKRRSIYVLAKRNMRYPLFDAFDQPDMHNSCPCRDETTTAPQALVQLNSELSNDLADTWAERLDDAHAGDDGNMIRAAYLFAFGREAYDDEVETAMAFLMGDPEETSASRVVRLANLKDFCHALFNANEFLFVD